MDSSQSAVLLDSLDLSTAYTYPLVFFRSTCPTVSLRDPADALPTEIMSNIFLWLSLVWPPSSKYKLGWMAISHVDSKWRDIALRTPLLWARIQYGLPHILQTEMMARAREVPIHWTVPTHINAQYELRLETPWSQGPDMPPWQEMQPFEPLVGLNPDFDFQLPPEIEGPPPFAEIEVDFDETDSDSDGDEDDFPFAPGQGIEQPVPPVMFDPIPPAMFNLLNLQAQQVIQAFQPNLGGPLPVDPLPVEPFIIPDPTAVLRRNYSRPDDAILEVARSFQLSGLSCSAGFFVMLLKEAQINEGLRVSLKDLEITQMSRASELNVFVRADSANAVLLSSCLRHLIISYSSRAPAFGSNIPFCATPPDFWARLQKLTHLKMTFEDAFPGQDCIAALQKLPALIALEISTIYSLSAASSDLPAQTDSGPRRAILPALQELTLEDRSGPQRMSSTLLSQLVFPSSARVRLFLRDNARSFLGKLRSHHLTVPQDIRVLDIFFDFDALHIGGWPGLRAYQLGERGADLFITVESEWKSGNTQVLLRQTPGWFLDALQSISLQIVSVVKLTLSGAKSATLGWAWLARCTSLQELSVDVEVDKPSSAGGALRGLLMELGEHGGGHRELRSLQLQGHMLRNGADDALLRWLKRRKAAGIPLSRLIIDDPTRAKLQALRRDWVDHLRRYVEHVECDFGWGSTA